MKTQQQKEADKFLHHATVAIAHLRIADKMMNERGLLKVGDPSTPMTPLIQGVRDVMNAMFDGDGCGVVITVDVDVKKIGGRDQ